ncbi:MAG: hypothetical protein JWP35_814 [Caulobacter sp.]|nr:hypothetical protein [Caulobacter sp.]
MSDAAGQRRNETLKAKAGSRAAWPHDLAAVLVAGLIAFALGALAVLIVLRA